MKTASVNELKTELTGLPAPELVSICIRLIKFKKENKELLHYLLFQSYDEQAYIELVKNEISEAFTEVSRSNLYYAKKTIRKILRSINKYIRYTASKSVETELLIYFCRMIKDTGIKVSRNKALFNLYQAQLKRIGKTISALHEDLQHDFQKELEELNL